jgi:hypothetical protein
MSRFPIWSPPSGFPTKILYVILISYTRATYTTHVILHDLVALIVFGEEYKSGINILYYAIHVKNMKL